MTCYPILLYLWHSIRMDKKRTTCNIITKDLVCCSCLMFMLLLLLLLLLLFVFLLLVWCFSVDLFLYFGVCVWGEGLNKNKNCVPMFNHQILMDKKRTTCNIITKDLVCCSCPCLLFILLLLLLLLLLFVCSKNK